MSLSASAPWLKYYGEVPHHLTYPQKTIYQMVRDAAIRDAKLPAYEFMGKKTTFAQFMEKIDQTAQAFLAMGIQKGDRVTICMPNCPQALHAFYGLNRIGAVSNMIHPLSAAGEIKFYLNFSHSKCNPDARPVLRQDRPRSCRSLTITDCEAPASRKLRTSSIPHLALGYALTAGAQVSEAPERKGNYIWWSEFLRVGKKLNLHTCRRTTAEARRRRFHPLFRRHHRHDQGHSPLQHELQRPWLADHRGLRLLPPSTGIKMLSVMPVFHGFGLGIGIHTALIGGACCILVPKFNVTYLCRPAHQEAAQHHPRRPDAV